MTRLDRFGLTDMVRHGAALRGTCNGASCMEDVARAQVVHFYESLVDQATGARSCALVRFFKTHPLGGLPPELGAIARGSLKDAELSEDIKCLTLLATRGERAAWNDIKDSRDHRTIPLPSPAAVRHMPLILRLVEQFGVELERFFDAGEEPILDTAQKTYNVFYVEDARTSPHVPAREFVADAGVVSVLGFGGMLSSGDLFSIIMFCKVRVPRNVAHLFRTLALNATMAVEQFAGGPFFATRP